MPAFFDDETPRGATGNDYDDDDDDETLPQIRQLSSSLLALSGANLSASLAQIREVPSSPSTSLNSHHSPPKAANMHSTDAIHHSYPFTPQIVMLSPRAELASSILALLFLPPIAPLRFPSHTNKPPCALSDSLPTHGRSRNRPPRTQAPQLSPYRSLLFALPRPRSTTRTPRTRHRAVVT